MFKKTEPSKARIALIERATELKLEVPEKVTVKQLKALIKTEELKADLPTPPPPPPAISFKKLKNKDVMVKIEPGKGARILQGLSEVKGEDAWNVLCVVSPPGAPNIRVQAKNKVKKLRLMLNDAVLETVKI